MKTPTLRVNPQDLPYLFHSTIIKATERAAPGDGPPLRWEINVSFLKFLRMMRQDDVGLGRGVPLLVSLAKEDRLLGIPVEVTDTFPPLAQLVFRREGLTEVLEVPGLEVREEEDKESWGPGFLSIVRDTTTAEPPSPRDRTPTEFLRHLLEIGWWSGSAIELAGPGADGEQLWREAKRIAGEKGQE